MGTEPGNTLQFLEGRAATSATMARLHTAGGDGAAGWTADAVAGVFATAGGFGLMALSGGKAVGFILCRALVDEAEVLQLAVLPEARRHGVGRGLLAGALERARQRGLKRMVLEVAEDNAPALALYRSAGFLPVGERPAYYAAPAATPAGAWRRARLLALALV